MECITTLYQYEIDQAVKEFLERAGIEIEAPLNLGDVAVEDAAAEGGVLDGHPNSAVLLQTKLGLLGCANITMLLVSQA